MVSRIHPRWFTGICIVFFMATTAFAGYNIWTSEYTVKHKELQAALNAEFPKEIVYKDIFEVTVSQPRLSLRPDQNRVVTTVSTAISSTLLLPKPVVAELSLSSALTYDPGTRGILLDNPAMESARAEGIEGPAAEELNQIVNNVVQEVLNHYPIYTFTPEQLSLKGQAFEPGKIHIDKDQIRVEIRRK